MPQRKPRSREYASGFRLEKTRIAVLIPEQTEKRFGFYSRIGLLVQSQGNNPARGSQTSRQMEKQRPEG